MKFISPILIYLIFSTFILGQVITVTDIESGEKLEFVNILSNSPKAITVTNSLGEANISLFRSSKEVIIQLLGYKKEVKTFKEIEENNYHISLLPIDISIDQIIISATKWHQSHEEITSKISAISSKEVEFQNPQTAADLLSLSGDLYIQKSQQGGGSPMIRGFATNRVLISVDGIRMNNAIFRSGNVQNVISLDPFSIENTEILFGPGSIIYGSDAIGGSMNFYTLRPQFAITNSPFIKGSTTYRYSSANGENTGHFDLNLGWKNFASLTSVSYNSYGDLRMGSNGPDDYLRDEYVKRINGIDQIIKNEQEENQVPSEYNQINLLQKLRYSPREDWYIDYGFHYSATTDFDRYDRLIRYNDGLPKSAEWYYGPHKWMLNNLTITNLFSNPLYDDLALRIAYQYFAESRNDREFEDVILRTRNEEVRAYSLNIDMNKKISANGHLLYGIEAVFNDVYSEGINNNIINNENEIGPARYPESSWLSLGTYFVYQRNLSENLFLQTGLRYNFFNIESEYETTFYPFPFTSSSISDGSLTGSLGLSYTPQKSWSIGLNLSSGFRAPNVDDIGKVFDSEPGSVVVPNPSLNAEKAYNIELGIAKVFNEDLKLDITGYYTYLQDAMVRRDFQLNGLDSIIYNNELSQVQAIQNASNAFVYGIQAQFEFRLMHHLVLSSTLNYQKGEEELDNGERSSLRHSAPMFGSIHMTYRFSNFRTDLYLNYNGEISYSDLALEERSKVHIYAKDSNGNPFSPDWYTLNFKVSYVLNSSIILNLGLENITDQRYRPYSSGLAAGGRNFIVSAKLNF